MSELALVSPPATEICPGYENVFLKSPACLPVQSLPPNGNISGFLGKPNQLELKRMFGIHEKLIRRPNKMTVKECEKLRYYGSRIQ